MTHQAPNPAQKPAPRIAQYAELPPMYAVLKRQLFGELDHLERKYGRVAVREMMQLWETTE